MSDVSCPPPGPKPMKPPRPVARVLAVRWLVLMSNAFNLIHGLDGLAAGLAVVSTLGLLFSAVLSSRW